MPERALCCQRPCFCEICIGCSLYDLLDERARLLRDAFDDHAYSPDFERALAEELIAGIPAARRAAALEIMVSDHLSPRAGAPKGMSLAFTFEKHRGMVVRDGTSQGCPLWYYGDADYERAHDEADDPAPRVDWEALAGSGT